MAVKYTVNLSESEISKISNLGMFLFLRSTNILIVSDRISFEPYLDSATPVIALTSNDENVFVNNYRFLGVGDLRMLIKKSGHSIVDFLLTFASKTLRIHQRRFLLGFVP
jgi:hypothetical protein